MLLDFNDQTVTCMSNVSRRRSFLSLSFSLYLLNV
jgi:hypothetical protein